MQKMPIWKYWEHRQGQTFLHNCVSNYSQQRRQNITNGFWYPSKWKTVSQRLFGATYCTFFFRSLMTLRKHWLTIPSALSMTGISSSLSWLWSRPRSACWNLSIRSPVWSIITVSSTVSMATLPLHFCYHFVSHLVSGPHIGPVPIKHTQTISDKAWNFLVWTLLPSIS